MARRNCRKEENEKDCPCQELGCENHGICCECISYHRKHGDKIACLSEMNFS